MKKNTANPRPLSGKKAGAAGKPAKKRRRKKPGTGDRVRAVMVAAVMILSAAAVSLALIRYNAVKTQHEVPALAAEGPAAVSGAREAPPPVQPPAPVETRPPVQSPEGIRPAPVAAAPPPVQRAPAARPSLPAKPPEKESPPPAAPEYAAPRPAAESRNLPAASLPPASTIERPSPKGALVFVIDDAGNNPREIGPFLEFPGPITIAVLPGLPHSAETARRVRAAGKEVFLHQPMESLGGHNPGPGAIMAGMGRDEIRAIISRNLEEVGPVAGINNHEGSRITMDAVAMEAVLSVCRERGILFLDSRTTAETAAPGTAARLGMKIGERDVFVDNVQERESMLGYIDTGLRKAEQKGSAVMIGHAWSPQLAGILAGLFPELSARGYSFSTVSNVINGAEP